MREPAEFAERSDTVRERHATAYPPIRDLAAIGDGRTIALVSLDGTICWLPVPSLDSATVFGSLLDAEHGGRFALAPVAPSEAHRRYLPDTNVLETTFTTATGTARVIDAMTLPSRSGLAPFRELVRLIEGIDGSVEFAWNVTPRFGYGADTHTALLTCGPSRLLVGNFPQGLTHLALLTAASAIERARSRL